MVYKLNAWSQDFNSGFTLNCLFGGLKLAINADPDKYIYTGYVIGFVLRSESSLPEGSEGENVIIFGVGMKSSLHIDNKKKIFFDFWKRSNTSIR